MKKVRILSIDGGGIRGIIPGVILNYLEKQLQQYDKSSLKIGDYFDFIAGTSTGGILACAYLMPSENGTAKYGAEDALNLYIEDGNKIFGTSFMQQLVRGFGWFDEHYSATNLEAELLSFFGDTTLDKLIKPCLITAYEIVSRRAYFFTSLDARKDNMCNFKVTDVARATSAAPTYFEPAKIFSLDNQEFNLIDGGVYANNPALCAYAEARKIQFSGLFDSKPNQPKAKDMLLISIGTGTVKQEYHFDDLKNAGEISWVHPLIDILMSGNSETVNYQLRQMYNTLNGDDRKNYYRLEPSLREADTEMDNTSISNLKNLEQAGKWFVDDNKAMLDEIVQKLIENK